MIERTFRPVHSDPQGVEWFDTGRVGHRLVLGQRPRRRRQSLAYIEALEAEVTDLRDAFDADR